MGKPRGVNTLGSVPNGEPPHSYLAITAEPQTVREGVMDHREAYKATAPGCRVSRGERIRGLANGSRSRGCLAVCLPGAPSLACLQLNETMARVPLTARQQSGTALSGVLISFERNETESLLYPSLRFTFTSRLNVPAIFQ